MEAAGRRYRRLGRGRVTRAWRDVVSSPGSAAVCPARVSAPDSQCMGKVVNAPTTPNAGGFENRVSAPAKAPVDKTAGANTGSAANVFEQRVAQEQGTH